MIPSTTYSTMTVEFGASLLQVEHPLLELFALDGSRFGSEFLLRTYQASGTLCSTRSEGTALAAFRMGRCAMHQFASRRCDEMHPKKFAATLVGAR